MGDRAMEDGGNMAKRFEGGIKHTEETIRLLYKTESHTYGKMQILTKMAIGAILVLLALLGGVPMAARAVLLLVGCWLLVSRDFSSSMKADRAVEARHGALPAMSYTFDETGVTLEGEGSTRLAYERVERLVEDDRFLYLFLGKGSACMVDRETVGPAPPQELMQFVEEKTGLEWRRDKSLLAMNVRDLIQAVRDRRRR